MKTLWTLQPEELASLGKEGNSVIGTMRNPQARDLYRSFGTRRPGSGREDAFLYWGSVEMMVGDGLRHDPRPELLPVCRKRAVLYTSGEQIKASVSEDEAWQFDPALAAQLSELGISVPASLAANPVRAAQWLNAQLGYGYGAAKVATEAFIGLSSGEESSVETSADEKLATSYSVSQGGASVLASQGPSMNGSAGASPHRRLLRGYATSDFALAS